MYCQLSQWTNPCHRIRFAHCRINFAVRNKKGRGCLSEMNAGCRVQAHCSCRNERFTPEEQRWVRKSKDNLRQQRPVWRGQDTRVSSAASSRTRYAVSGESQLSCSCTSC